MPGEWVRLFDAHAAGAPNSGFDGAKDDFGRERGLDSTRPVKGVEDHEPIISPARPSTGDM
jgi:hypothetical protein